MKRPNDFKNYVGDVSLESGGVFINLDDFKHGYANCLRTCELSPQDTTMAERITVYFDDPQKVKQALDGYDMAWFRSLPVESRKLIIIEACASYGLYDVVSDFMGDHRWIIHEYCPWWRDLNLDGWKLTNVIGYYKKTTKDGIEYSCHQDIMSWLYYNGMLVDYD